MSHLEAQNALGRAEMSRSLRESLQRAITYAYEQSHAHVTLEHLLLALADDREASVILEASAVDVTALTTDVSDYLGRLQDRVAPGARPEPALGQDVQHIMQSAGAAAQKSQRRTISSALALAAVVGDGRSPAAQMLKNRGLTFENAITALKQANAAAAVTPVQQNPAQQQSNAGAGTQAATQPATKAPAKPDTENAARTPAPADPPAHGVNGTARLQNMQAAHEIIASARERIAAARGTIASRVTDPPEPLESQPAPGEHQPKAQPMEPHPEPDAVPAAAQLSGEAAPAPRSPFEQGYGTAIPRPAAAVQPVAAERPIIQAPPVEPAAPAAPPITQPPASNPSTDRPVPEPIQGPRQREAADTDRQVPVAARPPARLPEPPTQSPGPIHAAARPATPPQSSGGHATHPPAAPHLLPGRSPPEMIQEGGHPQAPLPNRQVPQPLARGPQSQITAPPQSRPVQSPQVDRTQAKLPSGQPVAPAPSHWASNNPSPPQHTAPPSRPFAQRSIPDQPARPHQREAPPPDYDAQSYTPPPVYAGPPTQVNPIEPDQLVQDIPTRMCMGVPVTVEVRAPRARLEAWSGGGSDPRNSQIITKAMVMRLKAPEGGFTIEIASPETQWSETSMGPLGDDDVSWRWIVTPTRRGRHPLQLSASTRVVGSDGLAAARSLPDQVVSVRNATNYLHFAGRAAIWLAIACMGVALGYFGEGLFGMANSILAQAIR